MKLLLEYGAWSGTPLFQKDVKELERVQFKATNWAPVACDLQSEAEGNVFP